MATIAEVYAQVPDVACKGLCADYCGPIGCSAAEADAMREDGVLLPSIRLHPVQGVYTCSHLTDAGRCAIYAHRPLICRLFGAVRRMRCPHGCKPTGGYLGDDHVAGLMDALDDGRPDYHAAPEVIQKARGEMLAMAQRQAKGAT